MIGFLQRLTEKLRAHNAEVRQRNAERWREIRERNSNQAPAPGEPTAKTLRDERYEEFKEKPMPEPTFAPLSEHERLKEKLKSGNTRMQKRVNWFVAPVIAIVSMVLIKFDYWPASIIRPFVREMGMRGDFFVFLPVALVVMIPVAIVAAIISKILVQKYDMNDEEQL